MRNMNYSLKLLLTLCLVVPAFMSAQPVSHRFGGTSGVDWAHSAQFDRANVRLVTAGESSFLSAVNRDAAIQLMDPCFNPIASAVYGAFNGATELFNSLKTYNHPLLGGTGYVSVGSTNRTGDTDAYVVLTRPNLTVFQAARFHGGFGEDVATSVVTTNDGGFAFCGRTWNGSDFDMFVVKYNANLTFQWSRRIGRPGGDDRAFSIIQNAAGNLIVAGGTESFSITGTEEVYVVELTLGGIVVVSGGGQNGFIIATKLDEHATDIGQDPANGNYYITGEQDNGNDQDIILIQFNPTSGLLTQFAFNQGRDDVGNSIVWDQVVNQFKIVGFTRRPTFGSMDGVWLSVRPDGTVDPFRSRHYGSNQADSFEEIDQEDFGSLQYFVGGFTRGFTTPALTSSNFYWIYALTDGLTGCNEAMYNPKSIEQRPELDRETSFVTWRGPVALTDLAAFMVTLNSTLCTMTCKKADGFSPMEEDVFKVEIYPNPAQDQLHIQTDAIEGLRSVRILDLNGRQVVQAVQSPGHGKADLNVGQLSSGVYFAEIHLENGEVQRIKWVKK